MLKLPHLSIFLPANKPPALELSIENCTIRRKVFDNEQATLVILGTPILGEKIALRPIWEETKNQGLTADFLRRINGEFLLAHLNKATGTLQISTDRFTSIPFFHLSNATGFFGSVYYSNVWEHLKKTNRVNINESAVFEFLWLQRLLGTKTYDPYSSFILAATTLTYKKGKTTTSQYWVPSFDKTTDSLRESAEHLSESLSRSIARKISDNPGKNGMFLSGGIDSRTVLGSFENPPVSFTIGVTENNEVNIARTVANNVRSPHRFIQIKPDPFSAHLDAMTILGGGMHAFDHAIFFGLRDQVSHDADVIFHGHGIDYMFQGMYLLSRNINVLNRRTSFKRPEVIGDDFVNTYLNRIGHRLKEINLIDYVIHNRRTALLESIRNSVEEIQKLGSQFCETPDDHWEYMLIHGLARHYPFTNLTSIGTVAEQRVVAFDNDIFDLYLSLPKNHRLDGKIVKNALKLMNPKLAAIPTANTNQRPNQSALQKDVGRIIRFINRKTPFNKQQQILTTAEERTWPDRGRMFVHQPNLKKAANALRNSDALESLGFINMNRLNKDIPDWLESPKDGSGAFLSFLVTIDRFIKFYN